MPVRQTRLARYHRFYRLVSRERICVYCGSRATTIDHFVPLSVVYMLMDVVGEVTGKFLVPSCGECNRIASDFPFRTIAAKRRYIHEKLRKRYKKLLALPTWHKDEIDELSHSLADHVRSGMVRKAWLEERLKWRNTSNKECVSLAAIRFRFLGDGKRIAETAVASMPITSVDANSSSLHAGA